MTKTQTFDVVLTEEPTPEEARERGKIGLKVFDDRITARDRDGALVKAAFLLAMKEGADKTNLDMLAAVVRPFCE